VYIILTDDDDDDDDEDNDDNDDDVDLLEIKPAVYPAVA
jgi:hypothetical protein